MITSTFASLLAEGWRVKYVNFEPRKISKIVLERNGEILDFVPSRDNRILVRG